MAAPVYEIVAIGTPGAQACTISKPAGTVDGNTLVAFLFFDNHDNFGAWSISGPAGWAERHDQVNFGSERVTGAMYTKLAGASEPADYTFTSSAGILWGFIIRVSGTVGYIASNMQANNFSQRYPVDGLDVADESLVIYGYGIDRLSNTPPTPTGFTDIAYSDTTDGDDLAIYAAHRTYATAQDTGTIQLSSDWTNAPSVVGLITLSASAPPTPAQVSHQQAEVLRQDTSVWGARATHQQVEALQQDTSKWGARVTHETVDVLRLPIPWAQVSHEHIEVLRPPYLPGVHVDVEVAFQTNPDDQPIWESVQDFVESFNVRRGRQRRLGETEAGTLDVTLDNDGREFDPSNVSSPYHPNVIPMRRVRVRAAYKGIQYSLFDGYVDTWPQRWGDKRPKADLQATDAFKVMTNLYLQHPYDYEVREDQAIAYYKFYETSMDEPMRDSVGNNAGAYDTLESAGNSVQFAYPDPVADMEDHAILFPYSDQGQPLNAARVPNTLRDHITDEFSVEFWFAWETGQPDFWSMLATNPDGFMGYYLQFRIVYHSTEDVYRMFYGPLGWVVASQLGEPDFGDYRWHHVVGTWKHESGSTTWELYVDGVKQGSLTKNTNDVPVDYIFHDDIHLFGRLVAGFAHPGALSHMAFYPVRLSQAQVTKHYDASWANLTEKSGSRINYILDQVGFDPTKRDIDAGNTELMSAKDIEGQALIQHAQDVAKSERGLFYMRGDGFVRFRERHASWKPPAVLATFGDDVSLGYIRYEDIQTTYDDTELYNVIELAKRDNDPIVLVDLDLVAKYLKRMLSERDLLIHDYQMLIDTASYLLSKYGEPRQYVSKLVVDPKATPEDNLPWETVFTLDIGDRVGVVRPGETTVDEVFVEGVEHDASGYTWRTTYSLSDATYDSGFLVLDHPTLGKLDSGNKLGY